MCADVSNPISHGMEIWTWYLFKRARRRAKAAKVKSL
jgi:hypothetical protein